MEFRGHYGLHILLQNYSMCLGVIYFGKSELNLLSQTSSFRNDRWNQYFTFYISLKSGWIILEKISKNKV
jgi:hypothetical protein